MNRSLQAKDLSNISKVLSTEPVRPLFIFSDAIVDETPTYSDIRIPFVYSRKQKINNFDKRHFFKSRKINMTNMHGNPPAYGLDDAYRDGMSEVPDMKGQFRTLYKNNVIKCLFFHYERSGKGSGLAVFIAEKRDDGASYKSTINACRV